jgi:geranylgeranyl pyrophosphate synthase
MLEAAVVAGAIVAGADEKTVKKLRLYSEKMGLLFQITDDILDASGDPALMGKTLGKDAAEDKLTSVSLLGLEGARRAAQKAEREAELALDGIANADYLICTVRRMLTRTS